MESLWKVEDVANYLAVPVSTVRYWTSKAFIPHIKLPASVRFHPDTIVQWAAAMSKGGAPPKTPSEIASETLSSHRLRVEKRCRNGK
jgi:excisionase family DNA binding protein